MYTSQAFLGMAFSVEGLLLAFHLKGTPLEKLVHLLLVITTAACAFFVFLEVVFPNSVLVSLARCWSVLLQGTWWCQVCYMPSEACTASFTYLHQQILSSVMTCIGSRCTQSQEQGPELMLHFQCPLFIFFV